MTHNATVGTVAFSPVGNYVVSGSNDNTARVWEAATGKEIARVTHDTRVYQIAFSPDGKYVASASYDNTVRVWEASTGREITRIVHNDSVRSLAFSPDEKYVETGEDSTSVFLWLWRPEDLIAYACAYLPRNLSPLPSGNNTLAMHYHIRQFVPICQLRLNQLWYPAQHHRSIMR